MAQFEAGHMKLFGRFRARREVLVREHLDARRHTRVVKFGCFGAPLAGLPCLAQSPSFGLRCNHGGDRKSTRLNSSHSQISYAVFCLKKKKNSSTRSAQAHIKLPFTKILRTPALT